MAAGKGDGEGSRSDDDSAIATPDEVLADSRDTGVDGQLCQTNCSLKHALALMMMMMIMVVMVMVMIMMVMIVDNDDTYSSNTSRNSNRRYTRITKCIVS